MNTKAILGSTVVGGLLGLGMLAGSLIAPGTAAAQVPKELAAAPIAQTAPVTPGTTTPGSTAPSTTAPGTSKAAITPQQAEAAALAASPGQTVDHTQLINMNGTPAYNVDFTNGGGVIVNATTGAVITAEAAGTDKGGRGGKGADQAALAAQATVTMQQAEATALKASPARLWITAAWATITALCSGMWTSPTGVGSR